MANAQTRPRDGRGWQIAVGTLAVIAAGLSVGIYTTRGHWPAELGGVEPVFFLLLGVFLLGYAWQDTL